MSDPSAPYTNPLGVTNIISGSPGCDEAHTPFPPNVTKISVFRTRDFGYSRMQVFNKTHLYLEYVSDELNRTVVDQIWLIQEKHGPYPN